MNRNTLGTGIGMAALAALTLALSAPLAAAQAADPAPEAVQQAPAAPRQPMPPGAGPAVGQGRPAGLNLTDEQKARIKALRDEQQAALKTTREALKAARQKLAETRKADTLDEAALRGASAALATAQADEIVLRARHRAQYLGILTPEQREIAKRRQAAGLRAERQMRAFQAGQLRAWRQSRRTAARGMRPGWGVGPGRGMGLNQPGAGWGQRWNGRQGLPGQMGPWGPQMMGPGFQGPGMRGWRGPGQPPPPDAPAGQPAPAPKKKL
jgi:Spy/CpxP family protein refolding chaperone